jgi:hypothetical protein
LSVRVAVRPHTIGPVNTSFIVSSTGGATFPSSPAPIFRFLADTGVTVDGTPNVTQVLDQSGNGYTLTNSGTVPFQASGLNGKACFAYNGNGGLASSGLVVNMGTASPGTRSFFWVGTLNSGATAAANVLTMIGIAGHNDFDGGAGDMFIGRSGTDNWYTSYTSSISDTFTYDVGYRFGMTINGSGLIQFYRNGAAVGTPQTHSAANDATCTLCLGRGIRSGTPTAGTDYFGKVQEVVGYNVTLTSPQIATLDAYLSAKWGV